MLAEPADHASDDHGVALTPRPLEERVDHATGGFERQGEEAPHGRGPRALSPNGDEVLEQALAGPAVRLDYFCAESCFFRRVVSGY